MPADYTTDQLVQIPRDIGRHVYPYFTKFDLCDSIGYQLRKHGWDIERDANLGRRFGIVDFMVEGIAVAVRMKGDDIAAVRRDIFWYSWCPTVYAVILATTQDSHLDIFRRMNNVDVVSFRFAGYQQ